MSASPCLHPNATPADIIDAIRSGDLPLSAVDLPLRTGEVCEAAVRHDVNNLCDVPHSLLSPAMCAHAVEENWQLLGSIPESLRTEELCLKAIYSHARALSLVPESKKTAEMIDVAVGKWGRALTWAPEAMRTAELCDKAVEEDGSALEFVPLQLRSRRLCRESVVRKSRRGASSGLRYAPLEEQNYWLCAMSVFHHPWSLRDVPAELKGLEICAIAVSQDPNANSFVPVALKDTPAMVHRIEEVTVAEDKIKQLEDEVRPALSPYNMRHNIWWDAQDAWERAVPLQASSKPAFANPWLDTLISLKRKKDRQPDVWARLCRWD